MGELVKTNNQLPVVAKPYEPKQQIKLVTDEEKEVLTKVLVSGDLAPLNEAQKWVYYKGLCERLGLDPFTRPFKLIKFQGKETLYADATLAEQLASLRSLTVDNIEEYIDAKGNLVIKCKVYGPEQNRFITARGVVAYEALSGDAAANAQMKCETKAFRRSVLKYCGLSEYQGAEDAPKEGVEVEVGPAKEAPKAVLPKRRPAATVAKKEEAPQTPPPEREPEPGTEPETEAEEVQETEEEVDTETGEVIYPDEEGDDEPPQEEQQPATESGTKRRKGWG